MMLIFYDMFAKPHVFIRFIILNFMNPHHSHELRLCKLCENITAFVLKKTQHQGKFLIHLLGIMINA